MEFNGLRPFWGTHEAGLNSDRPDFSSDVVFFLYVVYMKKGVFT